MKYGLKEYLMPEFSNLYTKGYSMRYIARKTTVSTNTVKKYLVLQGIKVKCKNIVSNLKANDDLLIGIYTGLWAGDGTQYLDRGYTIKICCNSNNRELIAFIQEMLLRLFDKQSRVYYEIRNRALIKFHSKFIYHYVSNILNFDQNKTYTVRLREPLTTYSEQFLKGFFLGLMLTDGCLKARLRYTTISPKLAQNVSDLLIRFKYTPHTYVHDRSKYGWKNLYTVSLTKKESVDVLTFLNQVLKELGWHEDFSTLKGYKDGPAVI